MLSGSFSTQTLGEKASCVDGICQLISEGSFSALKETTPSAGAARYQPVPVREGRKEGCSRKCMACKLYLIKAVKSKKIKLPKEPKSFILQDKLSDKNIVQHSRILGVKKYDV